MTHAAPALNSRLATIITGAVREPDRILGMGVEGVGKSTFAAGAPSPIFITAEEGASQIGVARFPQPKTFKDVLDDLRVLLKEEHPYKTVVIDTLDAVEPLAWKAACDRGGKTDIEDFGFGKGFTIVLDDWREMIALLDRLRREKGMEVILLAHAVAKNFSNPSGPDYARYEPNLNKQAALLFKGWTDTTLFMTFEEAAIDAQTGGIIKDVATKKRVKGGSTGRRVMLTQRTAAYDAKNRWNLPAEIEMIYPDSYSPYAKARDAFWNTKIAVNPDALEAECNTLLDGLVLTATDDIQKAKIEKARDYVAKNTGNGPALLKARTLILAL